jgi:tetratricopeptide (TPR) repeat protein
MCAQPDTEVADNLADWRAALFESTAFYESGLLAEAVRVMEPAFSCAQHFPKDNLRLPRTAHALAFLYQKEGRYSEAVSLYVRTIRLWKAFEPAQHDALLQSVDNLIGTYVEMHDYGSVRKLMKPRLIEMEKSATQPEDRATFLNMRGSLALVDGQYRQAIDLFTQALALFTKTTPTDDKSIGIVLANLSHVLTLTKHYQAALDAASLAQTRFDNAGKTNIPFLVGALAQAERLSMKLHRPADAERYYRRAVSLTQSILGDKDPNLGELLLSFSEVLRALRRSAQAKEVARRARMLQQSQRRRLTVDIVELAHDRLR